MTDEHKGRWLVNIRPDLYPANIRDAREYMIHLEERERHLEHSLRGAQGTAQSALILAERMEREMKELRKLFEEVELERDGMKAVITRLVRYAEGSKANL